jgi:HD superfamily phosphohydrolase
MEILDPIHGEIQLNNAEVAVLDSAAYQRLRSIKQLGFSEFSFPGATHNRYLHSLGVCYLAGRAFDSIFKKFEFSSPALRERLRQTTRLAALLHDIGHGPLSHTTEDVMPKLKELKLKAYDTKKNPPNPERQANHEDYTIKFITDSSLTKVLRDNFSDISPMAIACLVDTQLPEPDGFFRDGDWDFRPVLSQIISSEMDVDRMDYLGRDAYFCGTNYGKVELAWLIGNLNVHPENGVLHLALNRRALYTFDDFLLARHHMHLMVYFHHKSIIFEEMLGRYLTSKDCSFFLPADIEEYIQCNDHSLYQHLEKVKNPWARRIAERRPFRMLFEFHSDHETDRSEKIQIALENEGVPVIRASAQARLSKYHSGNPSAKNPTIFVIDEYDYRSRPEPIEQCTKIFKNYENIRSIDRLYVAPEDLEKSEKFLSKHKL